MLVQKTLKYRKKKQYWVDCEDIHVLQWINPANFSDPMTFLRVSHQIKFSVCSNKPHGVPASAALCVYS